MIPTMRLVASRTSPGRNPLLFCVVNQQSFC